MQNQLGKVVVMGILNKLFGGISNVVTKDKEGKSFVVFDLETTGLSRYYSEIIQIAAIKVVDGKVVGEYDRLIKPKKPIPEEITNINQITNEMVSSAPYFKQIIDEFMAFIDGYTLIGYNISGYDLLLLNNRLCIELGYSLSTKYIRNKKH